MKSGEGTSPVPPYERAHINPENLPKLSPDQSRFLKAALDSRNERGINPRALISAFVPAPYLDQGVSRINSATQSLNKKLRTVEIAPGEYVQLRHVGDRYSPAMDFVVVKDNDSLPSKNGTSPLNPEGKDPFFDPFDHDTHKNPPATQPTTPDPTQVLARQRDEVVIREAFALKNEDPKKFTDLVKAVKAELFTSKGTLKTDHVDLESLLAKLGGVTMDEFQRAFAAVDVGFIYPPSTGNTPHQPAQTENPIPLTARDRDMALLLVEKVKGVNFSPIEIRTLTVLASLPKGTFLTGEQLATHVLGHSPALDELNKLGEAFSALEQKTRRSGLTLHSEDGKFGQYYIH